MLALVLASGPSLAADESATLKEGLLNAARGERLTLQLARLCGADAALVSKMDETVTGDLQAMKDMLPKAAQELDAAASEGANDALRQFGQLGPAASDSTTCKQAIAFARSSFAGSPSRS